MFTDFKLLETFHVFLISTFLHRTQITFALLQFHVNKYFFFQLQTWFYRRSSLSYLVSHSYSFVNFFCQFFKVFLASWYAHLLQIFTEEPFINSYDLIKIQDTFLWNYCYMRWSTRVISQKTFRYLLNNPSLVSIQYSLRCKTNRFETCLILSLSTFLWIHFAFCDIKCETTIGIFHFVPLPRKNICKISVLEWKSDENSTLYICL